MPLWGRKNKEKSHSLTSQEMDYTILPGGDDYFSIRLCHSTNQIEFVVKECVLEHEASVGRQPPTGLRWFVDHGGLEGWCPVCQSKYDNIFLKLGARMKSGKATLFWEHLNDGDHIGCGQLFRVMSIEEKNKKRETDCGNCMHYAISDGHGWCKHFRNESLDALCGGFAKCSAFRVGNGNRDSQYPAQSQIGQWLTEVSRTQPQVMRATSAYRERGCGSCGGKISKGDDYCPHCGAKTVGQAVHCNHCGARIPKGGHFCTKCGTKR